MSGGFSTLARGAVLGVSIAALGAFEVTNPFVEGPHATAS